MGKVGLNIYKRKDGRYEGRYKKGRNRNRLIYGYVYSRTKKDAVRKLLEKQQEYGFFAEKMSSGALTVGNWLGLWFGTVKGPELKESSYAVYAGQIKRYLIPILGEILLSDLSDNHIRRFIETLRKKKLSESTVLSISRLLHSALKEALEQGHIRKLPGKHVWPKAVKKEEARCLEEKERKALLKEAEKRKYVEITAALYTGLRLGEIVGLQWRDVDFAKKTIKVSRTVQRIAAGQQKTGSHRTRLAVLSPKSRTSERELPMRPEVTAILKELRAEGRKKPEDYVFAPGKHPERPADPRGIQRRFKRVCESVGVKNAHFHTLRHTFATICMESGFDVETLRYLLGHSSARITLECYAHSTKKHRREMMQRKFRIAV